MVIFSYRFRCRFFISRIMILFSSFTTTTPFSVASEGKGRTERPYVRWKVSVSRINKEETMV